MVAQLFSRDVSQAIIASIPALLGIVGTVIGVLVHRSRKDVIEVKTFVNGQITSMIERVNEIAARVEANLPADPAP